MWSENVFGKNWVVSLALNLGTKVRGTKDSNEHSAWVQTNLRIVT